MASPTRWTWVWVNSWGWWWTRRPGMLQCMGSQRVEQDWATELNWTELKNNDTKDFPWDIMNFVIVLELQAMSKTNKIIHVCLKKHNLKSIKLCCSIAKSCTTLCEHMKCSTPGFPVFHCLPEFAQTHIHWVDDVIKSSHLLSPPSPLVPNHCQNQSFSMSQLSALGGQSIGARASALVLPMNIQGWFPLGLTGVRSLLSEGLVFSSTTVWKHPFFSAQPSLWSNSHIHIWYWKNNSFDYIDPCRQSGVSAF